MARRVSDSDAGGYRRRQRSLTANLVRDLRRIRRLLRLNERGHADAVWVDAMQAVVDRHAQASAGLAADFYDAQRALARARGRFTVVPEEPPQRPQVEAVANWATSVLRTDGDEPAGTLEQAQQRAEAGAQKMAADAGRRTILRAVRSDREAVAWARSAALGACAFCKMLASRGAVYSRDTVKFRAHDGCHCMTLPVFRGDRFELSPKAAEWAAIYKEFAAPHSGDQLRRFRAALRGIEEGRIEWSPRRSRNAA